MHAAPSSTTRRAFLARAGALGAASLAAPRDLLAAPAARDDLGALRALLPALAGAAPGLPAAPADERDEAGWRRVRRHFLLPPGDAFFNAGTLGATPRVVLERQLAHLLHVERDLAEWDYDPAHEQFYAGYYPERALREKAARLLGATADELSLTANATAGMNLVAHGLGLGAGSEVVIASDAHVGSRSAWELRDRRDGLYVRVVRPPASPDPEALVAMFDRASTPRTRVWAIEHLTSATGLRYPVTELCARARARGILTVVDGAQTAGHLRTDLRAMGCDAWFTSPHKWLLAPVGTGLLSVRREVQPAVWTTIASQHWEHDDAGFRLMQHGTASRSTLEGLDAALDFHLALGPDLVERRALHLAERLRAGLARIGGVAVAAPAHAAQRTGTVLWSVAGLDGRALQGRLWQEARVRVRAQGTAVRQCCHVVNLATEVDRTLHAAARIARAA